MKKQVIVVVHGVGVRQAGVAAAQLAAVLDDETGTTPDLPGWTPKATEDFLLHEASSYEERGLLYVFPAHKSRFERVVLQDGQARPQERVIADFFWGDISGTGLGLVQGLIGLIKIILGLAHAIRENAMDVYPGQGRRDRTLRWLAREAALLIHGPVAAINFVLFAGVAATLIWHTVNGRALLAEPVAELGPMWTELALGVGAVAGGLWLLKKAQVFLLRHLAGWIAVTGVAVLVIDAAQTLFPGAMARLMAKVNAVIFAAPPIDYGPGTVDTASSFAVLAAVLLGLMVLFWTLATVIAWVLFIDSWFRPRQQGVQSFVPQAIVLMSVLWMILMTAGWTVGLLVHWAASEATGFKLPLGLKTEMVFAGLRLVTPAVLTLVLLAAAALYIHARKARLFDRARYVPGDYLPRRETLAETNRLIVGRLLLRVLDLALIAMTALFLILVAPDGLLLPWGTVQDLKALNDAALPDLIFAVGLMTGLVVLVGRRGLAAGIAIFADVLVYLNDYSWTSRESRRTEPPRTGVERLLGIVPDGTSRKEGFWLRGRIHARLRRLMTAVIADEDPDEIVIVSHSQGTVIALDVICAQGSGWLAEGGKAVTLKLVTMGSPYTHLYTQYFPSGFPDGPGRGPLHSVAEGGLLADWINVFRVDDFVGTHIDRHSELTAKDAGKGWPREYPVPANGHTNYWVDSTVLPDLRAVLTLVP